MGDRIMIDLGAQEIRADATGFDSLANLHAKLSGYRQASLGIDSRHLGWIDAQLGACLLTIVNHSRMNGNDIQFFNIAPRIQTILQKNKTLVGTRADVHGTTIPVTSFSSVSEVDFSKFTRSRLMRPEMPRMSNGLKEKFFEGIDELFANGALWSKSPIPFFAGGQYFPRKDRLSFVLSDGGQGIQGSLLAAGKSFSDPVAAIDWAMEMNNSARQGDIPGGLGLGILKDFVAMNGGCLFVCSHLGYWESRNGRVTKRRLSGVYPGTVVSLEINTADAKSYHMQSAVNPYDIW
ncbi:hypothetical protein [Terasakiella pusilla]|uniref:hypothetical protein n=1 Tax=Terasakiella pusilla TaxID=64973 RepID=UPI003AA7B8A1